MHMQRLTSLWKSSTGGKIAIICGSLLSLCVLCVGISFLVPSTPSAEPTVDLAMIQTVAFETVLAQAIITNPTLTVSPTLTSAPTVTEIPQVDYPRVVAARFQTVQEALNELVPLHQEFTADVSLSTHDDWYSKTSAALFRVEAGIHEIASMKSFPPEYATFNQVMIQMDNETQLMSPDYTLALDNQDVEALNRATSHLSNIITYLNQGFAELGRLTVTATSPATLTPLPTATVLFIAATSSNTGFDSNGDGNITCGDFNTQAAAQQAYNAGYTQLDGNDNDGRACESLP
jgi:hypothetical protein